MITFNNYNYTTALIMFLFSLISSLAHRKDGTIYVCSFAGSSIQLNTKTKLCPISLQFTKFDMDAL